MIRPLTLVETIALLWLIQAVVPLAYREAPASDDSKILAIPHRSFNWKTLTQDPQNVAKHPTKLSSPKDRIFIAKGDPNKNYKKDHELKDKFGITRSHSPTKKTTGATQKHKKNERLNGDRENKNNSILYDPFPNVKNAKHRNQKTPAFNFFQSHGSRNGVTKIKSKNRKYKGRTSMFTYLTQHSFLDDIYNNERFKRTYPPMNPVAKEKYMERAKDEELFKLFEVIKPPAKDSEEYSSESDSYSESYQTSESSNLSFDEDFVWSADYVLALTRNIRSSSAKSMSDYNYNDNPFAKHALLNYKHNQQASNANKFPGKKKNKLSVKKALTEAPKIYQNLPDQWNLNAPKQGTKHKFGLAQPKTTTKGEKVPVETNMRQNTFIPFPGMHWDIMPKLVNPKTKQPFKKDPKIEHEQQSIYPAQNKMKLPKVEFDNYPIRQKNPLFIGSMHQINENKNFDLEQKNQRNLLENQDQKPAKRELKQKMNLVNEDSIRQKVNNQSPRRFHTKPAAQFFHESNKKVNKYKSPLNISNSVIMNQITRNHFEGEKIQTGETFDTILEYLYRVSNNTFIKALKETSNKNQH